jgi:peptide/nickel transport system substrate-binding protein
MESYWTKFASRQINRRRALQSATAAGVGATALALIGCGDGGSANVEGDSSGLLSPKTDRTSQAVAGGTWSSFRDQDLISTNPLTNPQGNAASELIWAYGLLMKHSFAFDHKVGPEAITGDVAESWEISKDGLTYTVKMRPGLKFHNIPPVNGRLVGSSDVKFSFDTHERLSPFGSYIFASRSPSAPIESVSTPDDKTVVIKLKFPYGPLTEALAHHYLPAIVPKEADGGFNADAGMIGTGPFMLTTYQQSSRLEYAKNPDYYVKGRPFVNKVTKPIVSDYAALLAQFETKAIDGMGANVRPTDVLRVKRDHPEMLMFGLYPPTGHISGQIYNFSKQADSPVRDVRVRRALSMTIDRDLYIDAMENTSQFEKEGIPVETGWNGPLASWFPNWIDPRNEKEFGEGAQYYKLDVANARKLISAAGLTKAKFPWGYYADRTPEHSKISEIVVNMANETGLFDITLTPLAYASTWREICQRSNGAGFAGVCFNSPGAFNEDTYLAEIWTPDGKFATSPTAIPGFTDEIQAARLEPDALRRGELIKAFQRKAAPEFFYMPVPGRSLGFSLRWPWLANDEVFHEGGESARTFAEVWIDEKKRV